MSAERRTKILAAYEKTEKDLAEDVALIKEWLKSQPHLPETPNDKMIEIFIVNNKFSLEKTKRKLDMYYTIRSLIPGIYDICNPKTPQMKIAAKTVTTFNLPKLVDNMYLVSFFKETGYLPPDADPNCWIGAALVNPTEILLQEQELFLGIIIVYDHQHLRMDHALKMTPVHVKNVMNVLEKVLSNRVKAFHNINYPPAFEYLMKIFKPLLKPKLFNKIQLHSSYESLAEHVPLEILPRDYGGKEKSVDELQELWNEKLKKYEDRFDQLDKLRVNENLRPTPMEDIESFGIQGTFKKLSVD